ncbi:MAG: septum formation protein Maf [Aureispira sp.]|nr:septum formation protein Maf [Aureispira sp.]
MQKKVKVLLASKSPRRHQLISELGFDFEIVEQDIEETFPDDMPKVIVPEYLAQQKAYAVQDQLQPNSVILASDTIVLLNDTIYHKPTDHDDAVRILSDLSGQMHQVVTGVYLLGKDKEVSFSEIADVYFDTLTKEEIEFYIKKYQPFDKAGAYAIQEWIGLAKILKIEGTYANIMGLPTHRVYQELMKF